MLIGDIHSHVDGAAFASFTDRDDEAHRPGLHVVVGRINDEPPDFHVEVVVDRTRFRVNNLSSVVQGYTRRRVREVPRAWIDQVKVMTWSDYKSSQTQTGTEAQTDLTINSERERLDNWLQTRNTGVPAAPDRSQSQATEAPHSNSHDSQSRL